MDDSAPMDDPELERALADRTRFGRLCHVTECGSTQDLAASDGDDAAVFWADHQTRGRGREAREWHDEPGTDLTATFRLTGVRLPNPVALPAAAPLAVLLAAEPRAGRPLRLRWPNDVMLDGRKLAGVLIDGRGDGSDRYLVGVGVNVNRTRFPADLEHVATSLSLATGHLIDRRELLLDLALRLHECVADLERGRGGRLADMFADRLGLLQREVVVGVRGAEHRGRLVGMDFDRLLLDGGPEFPLGIVRSLRGA
jgi:BirA family biotin operon repressor/biotin-[acetyl-CoA-carboxylase] ligase